MAVDTPMHSAAKPAMVAEIEVKYRVADASEVVEALRVRGVLFGKPVEQDDQAYAPADWAYGRSKIGVPFARLRTEAGRHLFTVKTPVDNEMACLEHETLVDDRPAMHHAVLAMGFVPTIRIVKRRRRARWDQVVLCLDDVELAGVFLEAEQVVPAGHGGTAAQDRLDELVRSLGVALERTTDTYDSLIRAAT